MGMDVIVCIGFSLWFIIEYIVKDLNLYILIPVVVGILLGKFCDIYFDWFIDCEYEFRSNKIIYSYFLNGFGMGSKKVKVTITSVNKYKLSHNKQSCTVYGNIERKMPLRPAQDLKKFEIKFDFKSDDGKHILEKLDGLKG
jgi:hypothetical protein